MAECALKVFIDFANEGGALSFYSSDPDKVVRFALANNLSKLNLSKFNAMQHRLHDLVVGNSSVTKLCSPQNSWTPQSLPALSQLVSLSIEEYAPKNPLKLFKRQRLSKLTKLELIGPLSCVGASCLPSLAPIPNLRKLKLTRISLPVNLPLQLASLPGLKTLSLIGCEDDEDFDNEQPPLEQYEQFAKVSSGLTSLSLSSDSVTAWNFCRVLPLLTNLQELCLEKDFEADSEDDFDGESTIVKCVEKLTQLKTLRLVEFKFDEQIAQALRQATGLQDLTLSIVGTSYTESAFGRHPEKQALFTGIECLQSLTNLDLSRQRLNLTHFHSIGKLTNLKNLCLRELDAIEPKTVSMLTNLTRLTTLDLQYSFRNGQQESFAPLLRMPNLRKLKLTDGDDTGKISNGETTSTLSTLVLTEDKYGMNNRTLEDIVEDLSGLPNLTSLYAGVPLYRFDSIGGIISKLENLKKFAFLATLCLNDGEFLNETRKLLKSKQIRFVESVECSF